MISIGCLNIGHRYPTSWPQPKTGNDIENLIGGTYACSGEIMHTDTGLREEKNITDFLTGLWEKRSMTGFLIGGKNPIPCQYLSIRNIENEGLEFRFMGKDDEQSLEFRFMKNDRTWKTLLKKSQDFDTESGWVRLKAKRKFRVGDTTAGCSSTDQYVSVTTAGDLLIKSDKKWAGIASVVPVNSTETVWGLFKRVKQ
jgi:hypothetical protein